MGNAVNVYIQTDRHDWLTTGYRQVDSATQQPFITYEGTAYSPDTKFRCEIPYGTRDLGQALSVCDAAADVSVQAPVSAPTEGQATTPDADEAQYQLLLRGYTRYAGKIKVWLKDSSRVMEGTSAVFYDPRCAPELQNREGGQCAYVADTDPTRLGMEEIYFPSATSIDSALLLQGGKRASFIDLISDLL